MTIALSDAHFTRHPVPLARQAADRRKAFYARMDQHARTMASEQRAILAAVARFAHIVGGRHVL